MDGHARPVELSEWQELLGAFQGCFRRPEGRKALEHYTIGLLTELPNQNGDTLAQAVQGAVNSGWPWRTIRWRHGINGWRRKKFVAGRGWRVTSEGPRHESKYTTLGPSQPRSRSDSPPWQGCEQCWARVEGRLGKHSLTRLRVHQQSP